MNTNNAVGWAAGEKKALATNDQSLVALVEASPLGIIVFNLDGNILLWNRAAEVITGWREKEVLGLPIWVIADDRREEYESLRRRTLNQEVFHSLPLDATRKDGHRIVISYSAAPVFDRENRIVATMTVIYDISEKMKMEADLKESLEKTNRVLDETVHSLSSAVEKRDPYTAGHQHRVAHLACPSGGARGDSAGATERHLDRCNTPRYRQAVRAGGDTDQTGSSERDRIRTGKEPRRTRLRHPERYRIPGASLPHCPAAP